MFSSIFFWVKCLVYTGMTPRKILKLFGRLSDCHIESPTEVYPNYYVRCFGSNVMIYGLEFVVALNFTDSRGLAIQYSPDKKEWSEGLRIAQKYLDLSNWVFEFRKLPKITKAAEVFAKTKGALKENAALKVEIR